MKKFVLGLLTAAMVLGSSGLAFAQQDLPQFCSFGYFRAAISAVDNWEFNEDTKSDDQQIYQRVRQYFEYSANENLTAQVAYEIDTGWGWPGESDFGNDEKGLIEIKRAQLTFNWPNTDINIQAGLSCYTAPGGMYGTPVLGNDMPGVFINTPFNDMASMTLGYIRADDLYRISSGETNANTGGDQLDAVLGSFPMNFEGFNLTPYAVYSWIGQQVMQSKYSDIFDTWSTNMGTIASQSGTASYDDEVDAFWLGLPFGITMIDPVTIKGQILYGNIDGGQDALDREGYYFDIAADYAMDMFTPSLYFIYSSGEDDDVSDGSETFPSLNSNGFLYPPSAASFGFNSHFGFRDGDYSFAQYVPHGLWTLGFALKDIQFVDKLSHTFAVGYSQGTNDSDIFENGAASLDQANSRFTELTDEDSSIEVTFRNNYKIYENLSAMLELDYASLDMDSGVWGSDYKDDDIIRGTFGLSYNF